MVKGAQYDLRRGLSGGADAWDEGLAGVILLADYFAVPGTPEPPVTGEDLQYWLISARRRARR